MVSTAEAGAAFRKTDGHVTRKVAEETIVVPIRARAADLESIFVLNEVGAVVWERLDADRSVDELASAVADEFEVDEETARADVLRFLSALQDCGLVEHSGR
jgi:Coenzyme PQQ synthesis protein D (PqqD)